MRRCLLALATAGLVCACGGPTKPAAVVPTPNLSMPSDVVGTELSLNVTMTGCRIVEAITIRSGATKLAERNDPGLSADFVISLSALEALRPADQGYAFKLPIVVDALCDGARPGTSTKTLTVLPADAVFPGPWDLNGNFFIEDGGLSLYACMLRPGTSSQYKLQMYSLDKRVQGTKNLSFSCNSQAQMVFANGWRYFWQPGQGIAAFPANQISNGFEGQLSGVKQVLPFNSASGMAALFFDSAGGWKIQLIDMSGHSIGGEIAVNPPAGPMVMNGSGEIVYPNVYDDTTSGDREVRLDVYGSPTRGVVLYRVPGDVWAENPPAVGAVSVDGTIGRAYSIVYNNGKNEVWSCPANGTQSCYDVTSWQDSALGGLVYNVVALPGSPSAVVAFGPNVAYVLDPNSGQVLGTYDAIASIPWVGAGSRGNSYVLFGTTGGASALRSFVLMDQPGVKVVSFDTAGPGYVIDVDASGSFWLLGEDLIKLKPLGQYVVN